MKRIIKLTERDLTRIVKRVINERQYLMEESTNSPEIFIPYKKIKNQQGETVDVPAKEAYAKSDYVTTFRILDGNPDTIKEITKNPSYLPYKLVSIELDGNAGQGTLRPTGSQKFVTINGAAYLTGTLVVGSATPKLGIHPSGIVTKFSDTTSQNMGGVQIKKGKEYIPTQKESDLRRIVKNVMNERRYLMEGMDPRIDTLLNNIVTQINSKITAINTSSKTKIPNVSFKEVPDGDTSVSYDFYMGQSNIGQLPHKYLLNNWSSFESKLYNIFKFSTNPSLSLVLKANGLGNNMSEFSNAATGVVYKILQGFQWEGKPTQKESDLRRIVKNVMNERRYLMEGEDTSKLEPAITNWINAMNAVYGTQMKLGKSGTNVNITGGVRDILLYALPLTFPDDKAKIYPRITNGFKTIKSDMAGQDPNKKLLFMTCIPKLASSGGKVPQGCETVMKDPSIITKANAMNTAYDNLVRLVTPAQ